METPQAAGSVHGEEAAAASSQSALSPPLSPATAAATTAAMLNARWNPTKEQVAVLEGLFDHGLRTPSAEQIRHITGKLREHGPVEPKNIFYWFQNHTARLRQRQKQDDFAYYTRMLRRPPPLPVVPGPHGQSSYPLARMSPAPAPVMTMAPPQQAAAYNNGGGGTHVMMYRQAPQQASAANAAGYYMPAPALQQASAANAAGYYMPAPSPHASAANAAGYYMPTPAPQQASSSANAGGFYMPAPAPQASSAANASGYYNVQLQQAAHHMPIMYPRMEIAREKQMNSAGIYQAVPASYATSISHNPLQVFPPANGGGASTHRGGRCRETLELFPLQPTFLLPTTRSASLSLPGTSSAGASASACEGEFETGNLVESPNTNAEALPFYDFFGLQSAAGR